VRSFVDLKSLAAKSEHLRHKRHPIELSLDVKGPENFILASDLYPVPDAQFVFCSFQLLHITPRLLRINQKEYQNTLAYLAEKYLS
jgi:hypothetical protein